VDANLTGTGPKELTAAEAPTALEQKLVEKLCTFHANRASEMMDAVPLTWLMRSAVGAVPVPAPAQP